MRRLPALAGLPLLIGCAGPPPPAPSSPEAPPPEIVRADFARELLLTGELEAVRSITVSAPQTNLFQMRIQFMAEEGSVVGKGDPLLGFDNSSFASQVRELETQILDAETQVVMKRSELKSALKDLEIELAEKEHAFARARLDASVDPGVLSKKEMAERQLALDKATRELDETRRRIQLTGDRGRAELDVLVINRDKLKKDLLKARNDLDLLTIEAPAAGLVVYEKRQGSTLRYQEGDSCWPGQGVIQLPDLEEMQVVFYANEVDAPLLREGMELTVTVDAFPGRTLRGTITHIPSMAVKRSESSKIAIFKVIARLSETWVGEMKPGMSTLGRIVVERMQDVPTIARAAVAIDDDGYWIGRGATRQRIEPRARSATVYVLSEADAAQIAGIERQPPPGSGSSS